MRRKRQDVILDFTSLLDVTLILIFFFVLFSHLDGEEQKNRTQEKLLELDRAVAQAQAETQRAQELADQLAGELETVTAASQRNGANTREILAYGRGETVKLLLNMEGAGWTLRVNRGGSPLATLGKDASLGPELAKLFRQAGYTRESTILCDLVYDGSQPGTASAYKAIRKGLDSLGEDYPFLYISETDFSIKE